MVSLEIGIGLPRKPDDPVPSLPPPKRSQSESGRPRVPFEIPSAGFMSDAEVFGRLIASPLNPMDQLLLAHTFTICVCVCLLSRVPLLGGGLAV